MRGASHTRTAWAASTQDHILQAAACHQPLAHERSTLPAFVPAGRGAAYTPAQQQHAVWPSKEGPLQGWLQTCQGYRLRRSARSTTALLRGACLPCQCPAHDASQNPLAPHPYAAPLSRYHICEQHMMADILMRDGVPSRFCQQVRPAAAPGASSHANCSSCRGLSASNRAHAPV